MSGHYEDYQEENTRSDEVVPCWVEVPNIVDNCVEDTVNWPKHYNSYPGIEVIQLTQHMNFCKGNICKYIARAEFKGNELQDLKKALWYLNTEIDRVEKRDSGS